MGRLIRGISEGAPRFVFFRAQWLWDAAFWVFTTFPPTRGPTQFALVRIGARGLARLIRSVRPDVVVSTYPQTTEVLGWLRRRGRLDIPVCAAVTDIAGLRYWAAKGIDRSEEHTSEL